MRKNFIQVLHTGGMHWVCVSNIGCRQKNEVQLYDNLYRGISSFTKEQIAALLVIPDSDQSSSLLLTSKRMEQTVVYLLSHLPQHSATS